MWLRSDKRELRIRNQPKTKFLNNHRKKRKRPRNQYSKTIKLMKNEKEASVLSTSQYSADELTLYNDKTIKAKKHNGNKKPSYIESLSFASDSKMNQFGPISYDLNTLDIDMTIRTSSIANGSENLDYGKPERFQALDAQYDFDCNYAKGSTEIHTVADLILKRKPFSYSLTHLNLILNCFFKARTTTSASSLKLLLIPIKRI